ncbi:DUF2306 domain-containing protein [Sphingorhabdus sp.]|jgi:uncharacterized membrane protein|uniref:DUF2306 domain-containing protein n=1 Tax=Sphingorhabdus sp. TaxID=1902408 RepID=UPI003BAE8992|nr:DUF2306 domain-containing protein [Sphingomonadales bacterium]
MSSVTPHYPNPITPKFVAITIAITIALTLGAMAIAMEFAGPSRSTSLQPQWAVTLHLMTVIPAFFLGCVVMLNKKGTRSHRLLGRIWAMLMMVTAITSFWLQGLFGGIGPIHIFSVMTLISIPRAIWAIRKGDVKAHQRSMTGPFIGLCVAGAFSFIPGRIMGNLLMALL